MSTPDWQPPAIPMAAYTYQLPPELIARQPLPRRDMARMLVYRQGQIDHLRFDQLPGQLPAGSLLVLNDTLVVPARLVFYKPTGARIEIFCLNPAGGSWEQALDCRGHVLVHCLVGNRKRWDPGMPLRMTAADGTVLEARQTAPATEGSTPGAQCIALNWQPGDRSFYDVLLACGAMPLPPYMNRDAGAEDRVRYQTVVAARAGSVAAPTASLHFTPELLADLKTAGVQTAKVTLHVGAGTFLPVTAGTAAGHQMHAEQITVSAGTIAQLLAQLEANKPIVAAGTTSLRTLESLYALGMQALKAPLPTDPYVGQWAPYPAQAGGTAPPAAEALRALLEDMHVQGRQVLAARTALMLVPGYRFELAEGLITNFHQPGSTLLLLVAAFAGDDAWQSIYREALAQQYRMLSYGDGSLLWRPRVPE